jgi:polyhydroxybutyrate depolymerase
VFRRPPVLLLLLALLAGCGPDRPDQPVTRTLHLADRTAIVHHPASAGAGSALVVMLHGGFGDGAQAEADYGWDQLADRAGFVVAYPDGRNRAWNAGQCCGRPQQQGVDDVAFLHQVVDQVAREDGVDRRRVYAVGMSNGAMMTYAWACGRPGELAGIGPVAGAVIADCSAVRPTPVVAVHGSADQNVPVAGGVGAKGVTGQSYPPLDASLGVFRTADGCPDAPTVDRRPPVTTSTWTCAGGTEVVLALVDGAGHQWPGGHRTKAAALGLDQPSTALDATAFLWQHLSQHTLP